MSTGVLTYWLDLVSVVAYRLGDSDTLFTAIPLEMARVASVLLLAIALVAAIARRHEAWRRNQRR